MTNTHALTLDHQSSPLCPNCGAPSLQVSTQTTVHYDLTYDPQAKELIVTGEHYGDSDWDLASEANCPICSWRGTLEDCQPQV